MSTTDKDNKATGASADDVVPYVVTDAPSSSADNTTTATTTATDASTENAKKATLKDASQGSNPSDDDDDLQVHPAATTSETTPPSTTTDITAATTTTAPAPTVEPTPSPQEAERVAKLAILTEAFPTVEKEICEFVLESHRGNVEASINALLEMSDPEYRPDPPQQPQPQPQQQQQQQSPPPQRPQAPQHLPLGAPPLPQRTPANPQAENEDDAAADEFARMRIQQQPRTEIDPILLASTSTSEQQLRSDEDFARTLAAMDEYRARRDQPHPQQQEDQGPSFTQELKELMDEELPKIKERLNVAADTTKKKVNEWYEKFKASRAEAAAREAARREQASANNEAYYRDDYRHNIHRQDSRDLNREPIRFGDRGDSDEPLARNRTTPPLPARRGSPDDPASIPVESDTTTTTLLPDGRRSTTVEEVADKDK